MYTTGQVDDQQIEGLVEGMSESDVLRLLGEPKSKLIAGGIETPGKVFASLGSTFKFPDTELECIWVYSHAQRERRTYYLGFKDGLLATMWKVTSTGE